ncbi:MAG: AmmeMemoRadiSam system radical SAM enzyme [Thermoplasmatota archaeon]
MKEAKYWGSVEGDKVKCNLCPHHCLIRDGESGICRVRENKKGILYSSIYGKAASLTADPIEKKPLYHFHPGTRVLSYGTMGCNFKCRYCQNASISCGDPHSPFLKDYSVDEIVKEASRFDGFASTYNEPTVSYEYSYDIFKNIKENNHGYTVYVTNGYIEEQPLRDLAPYLDAMNIDVKAFNEDFYKKIVKGKLQPVLDTCELAVELDIHVEVTYLVVPGYNDSSEEIRDFVDWVKGTLGEDTVTHFSKFHPDHNMKDVPATSAEKMREAREIALDAGLNFVYLGNLPADNDTRCPDCGEIIVSRSFFSSGEVNLKKGKCPNCGRDIPIVM